MKLYEITIKPISGFGTPLKGDTLCGHFCWQAAYDPSLLAGGLTHWIACYGERPFAVFSSAWPKFYKDKKGYYALKRPDLPPSVLFPNPSLDKKEQIRTRKENLKKKWLILKEGLYLSLKAATYWTDAELLKKTSLNVSAETRKIMERPVSAQFSITYDQQHNTINRLTMTTGEGMFAPFTESVISYYPVMELALFVLIDEEATDIEKIRTALERIGAFGFGQNASTGAGRFELAETEEIPIPRVKMPNACYALGPVVPAQDNNAFHEHFFTPFVRFGKHGDILATSGNPFKSPIIMADEGAVFRIRDNGVFDTPYIGRAVTNVSKSMKDTIQQGYSIYLPFHMEM